MGIDNPPTSGGGGGSGTVTSVDVSGGTTGLTFSGGPVTSSGTITAAGTLAVVNGGTGQVTASAAINALVPTQTGHNGEFLTTNGTVVSWAAAGGSSPLTTKGDLFTYAAANARLAVGTDGQILQADSGQTTGLKWTTLAGGGNVTGPGSSTDNAVTRFDGAGGVTIQNSGVIIDDSNNISGIGTLASGAHTITSASATALAVGPNGTTNPALQIDGSVSSSATGILVTPAASGSGVIVIASGGTNETLRIAGKGTGGVQLRTGSTVRLDVTQTQATFTPTTSSTAANARFSWNSAADTALTAATEAKGVIWDCSATRQHASNTTVALQREFLIMAPTHSFASATGTMTDAATFAITGAPVGGTNSAVTNAHAIYVPTSVLANTTNGYALNVAAPSGATNNYAAKLSGVVVNGGATPGIAGGSGAGTSPTVGIAGCNNGGVITITTGAAPGTSAVVATVTFSSPFPTGCAVVLTPGNAATSILSGTSMTFTTGSTTTFTITSGAVALVTLTQYIWSYSVIGY